MSRQPNVHASARAAPRGGLDAGEAAAIALALQLGADLVLMDDRKGVTSARSLRLRVTGTLGILDRAACRRLIHFGERNRPLRRTSFRLPEAVVSSLEKTHASTKNFT